VIEGLDKAVPVHRPLERFLSHRKTSDIVRQVFAGGKFLISGKEFRILSPVGKAVADAVCRPRPSTPSDYLAALSPEIWRPGRADPPTAGLGHSLVPEGAGGRRLRQPWTDGDGPATGPLPCRHRHLLGGAKGSPSPQTKTSLARHIGGGPARRTSPSASAAHGYRSSTNFYTRPQPQGWGRQLPPRCWGRALAAGATGEGAVWGWGPTTWWLATTLTATERWSARGSPFWDATARRENTCGLYSGGRTPWMPIAGQNGGGRATRAGPRAPG